jgi:cytochrome c5
MISPDVPQWRDAMSDASGAKLPRSRARGILIALAATGGMLSIAAQGAMAQATARSGEQVVKTVCAACHQAGKSGAPRIGDREAWIPRLKQGVDSVVSSAIRGHGGMPPRGGQANLTDVEIRNAVLYMFNPAGAAAKEETAAAGGAKEAPVRPRSNYVKTAGGMEIHLGLVPAASLRKYPKGSPEASMHGGVPRGTGIYHLNVSLVDGASKAPVSGARVEAKVEQVGLSSDTKLMEPIRFDNVTSYGNYFKLGSKTSYRITVKVQKQGSAQASEVQFEHRVN